jgi:hypothetical protein
MLPPSTSLITWHIHVGWKTILRLGYYQDAPCAKLPARPCIILDHILQNKLKTDRHDGTLHILVILRSFPAAGMFDERQLLAAGFHKAINGTRRRKLCQ